MTVPAASRSQALALYRALLREGKHYKNYNFREFIVRRVREDFRAHSGEQDPAAIQKQLAQAKSELELVQRQRIVQNMYTAGSSILETRR